MKVKVCAKLNLTLAVGAKRGEFHPIDSVATSIDLYDVVEVVERSDNEVHVSGVEGVEQQNNTAYKAACAFVEEFSTTGVDVFIRKGIPFGAGLGGSSADAAAVLFCLCQMKKIDMGCEKLLKICKKVGSDVTFMLHGGLGRMSGKGDDVEYFQLKQPLYFALTTFDQNMSSRDVYEAFDRVADLGNESIQNSFEDGRNNELLSLLQNGANAQVLMYLHNDLQRAATSISNYAERYLNFTKSNGLNAVMTGSGSAYYVAFANRAEAQAAVDFLNSNGYTSILCQSVPSGIEIC